MNDESFEQIERQLASLHLHDAPRELRGAVLADVRRELRAGKWDRRLALTATVLLVVGVGLNVAIGLRSTYSAGGSRHEVAASGSRQSLVETAVVVAEATDAATGRQYARQLAAMTGHELTPDEAAAIDAAVRRATTNGNKG